MDDLINFVEEANYTYNLVKKDFQINDSSKMLVDIPNNNNIDLLKFEDLQSEKSPSIDHLMKSVSMNLEKDSNASMTEYTPNQFKDETNSIGGKKDNLNLTPTPDHKIIENFEIPNSKKKNK
jgi:hypothetical protein